VGTEAGEPAEPLYLTLEDALGIFAAITGGTVPN